MTYSLVRFAALGAVAVIALGFGAAKITAPQAPEPLVAVATSARAQVKLPRSADGHYWADAWVNGTRVRFLVDTGASVVSLTEADARRLGYRLNEHDFTHTVLTATGTTKGAVVMLSYITIDDVRVTGVEAIVLKEGLTTSLFGMNYLNRFSRVELAHATMTLER
jgi:aspartyl protease family protein